MKKHTLLILLFTPFLLLTNCKHGYIKVKNNISNVKISEIKWGDHFVQSELLPGETSEQITINHSDKDLRTSQKVTFVMTSQNKSIFLETKNEYWLGRTDEILIVLDDNTQIKNSNE